MTSRIVETSQGRVRGTTTVDGIQVFKGIPYAASTAGRNRFLPPQPAAPWTGVFDATSLGQPPPQDPSAWIEGDPAASAIFAGITAQLAAASPAPDPGEDCLVLNVYTRSVDEAAMRPVMVWWHGGAWSTGSGDAYGMDTAILAKRDDVVFVSVNHRLNVFGYLHLGDGFGEEYSHSGNVGMLDLAASLEWIRENIRVFGGNPNNITVFGGSGGGAKVVTSMAMPAFSGLYQHAICMSGHDLWKRQSVDVSEERTNALLAELGIRQGESAKLVALSTQDLERASAAVTSRMRPDARVGDRAWVNWDWFCPVIDGIDLPADPASAIAAGAGANVDLMIGTTEFEHWNSYGLGAAGASNSCPPDFGWMDEARLVSLLHPFLGEHTKDIVTSYRTLRPGMTPSLLLPTIIADRDWRIPAIRIADAKELGGGPPPYMYYGAAPASGNIHGFVFDDVPTQGAARGVLSQVAPAWLKMAEAGNPNHDGLPAWPVYSARERRTMVIGYESRVVNDPWSEERQLWDGIR